MPHLGCTVLGGRAMVDGRGPGTEIRVWRVPHLQIPHPITSHLSQPPSTERTRLRTIIRAMVAMTTGVDFVSIFSPPDCKERGSLR